MSRVHSVGPTRGPTSVTRIDWSFADRPAAASATSSGLARDVLVGREQGAAHTELAVGALAPGGWLRRHVHSFEEALYVLQGELAIEIGGVAHRLVAGDFCLIPIGTWHALANAGEDQVRWLSVNTPQRLAPDAGPQGHVLHQGPFDAAELVARAVRPAVRRPGRPPRRPLRRHAAPGRGAARRRPGARPQAGRHGHGPARLQRDLGEDARRPGVRRRPADDVHRRLRDRRLGAAARPPVRGDLRVPRGRGRGRARRHDLHAAARRRRVRRASAACTASTTPGPSGFAGSRPRRRNPRSATRIAGRRRGRSSRRTTMSDDGAVVVVGGTRAIGRELVRHYVEQGRQVVLTGQSAENVAAAVAEHGDAVRGRDLRPRRAAHDRGRARRRRAGGPPGPGGDRPRPEQGRRLRHRPGDPPRHPQARRLHGRRVRAPANGCRRPSSIVLFGGMAKERPYPGSTTVTTVNGGVVGLTRTLVEELRPVRVNSIHPGVVGDSPYWSGKPAAIAKYTVRDAHRPPGGDARDRRRDGVPARERRGQRRRADRRLRLALPLTTLLASREPQPAAFLISAAILASSAAVSSVRAKDVGHMVPSSRVAPSLNPSVEYRDLNFAAAWKKDDRPCRPWRTPASRSRSSASGPAPAPSRWRGSVRRWRGPRPASRRSSPARRSRRPRSAPRLAAFFCSLACSTIAARSSSVHTCGRPGGGAPARRLRVLHDPLLTRATCWLRVLILGAPSRRRLRPNVPVSRLTR